MFTPQTSSQPAKTSANGAAVHNGSEPLLDRVVGAEPAAAIREKAQEARTSLTTAGAATVATARAHPLISLLALASGLAIIGLLINPGTRKAAVEGGTSLLKSLDVKLP